MSFHSTNRKNNRSHPVMDHEYYCHISIAKFMRCYWCDVECGGCLDRIDNNQSYNEKNIVVSCDACNRLRGGIGFGHFLAIIGTIYAFQQRGVASAGINTFPRKTLPNYARFVQQKRTRTIGCTLTEQDYNTLTSSPCFYCGVPNCTGIDRVNPDSTYSLQDVVPCCFVCNYLKGNIPKDDFLAFVNHLYKVNPGRCDYNYFGPTTIMCHDWEITPSGPVYVSLQKSTSAMQC